MNRAVWIIAVALVAVAVSGCTRKGQSAKLAAEQLQRSFAKADASVTQQVAQASTALQAGNYSQAILTMNRVVQTQPVDQAQKQAVSTLIHQTRQAIQQNPQLNSPQLYKAMSELVERTYGEN
jgi:hypothetical protein